jgi:diaminopimelate epimerase
MPLRFWKLESIGNDFPLIHTADFSGDLSALAIRMCDRHTGVGGDGLLTLESLREHELAMRMFNPDGTEDFCGNGLRCAARHAVDTGMTAARFSIRHGDRDIPVSVRGSEIAITLGVATYDPEKVPVAAMGEAFNVNVWSGMDAGTPLALFGSVLTTGSTHTIIPTVALPDDDTFRSVSAKIEVDPKFPQRTSVIWVQEVSREHLKIRVWERGVGETLGCGTGSSAAAADHMRRKERGGSYRVENPGGSVSVSADRWDAPLTITGEARAVFSGTIF